MEALDMAAQEMVLAILAGQNDLTLATVRPDGYPQATTVSFANDGLAIYMGVGANSQKARNIRAQDKVSLTVTLPYSDWQHIRGLSLAGRAHLVEDSAQISHASVLMLARYPQLSEILGRPGAPPWVPTIALLRVDPEVISVLDYTRGFGHTTLYRV